VGPLSIALVLVAGAATQAENEWVEVRRDPTGARRGCAVRWAPDAGAFLLWGFMNDDPGLLQELPVMVAPEYDVVAFDPAVGAWKNHLPPAWEREWTRKLPLAYVPRTYSGITTGSERIVLRTPTGDRGGVARPDLNVVFDQVAYHPGTKSLVYFTGGLTAAYDVIERRWRDLAPTHSPPPVLGGSLCHDPVHDEIVLAGGGHVAEPGPGGSVVGHAGTWIYGGGDWRPLRAETEPSPRMNARLVYDAKNRVLVLFGGDAQSHYLADTWIYDPRTRTWRASKAESAPEARAGHFTVYDPETGWVIVGGGYNRKDLTDMWAYDAAADRWQALAGRVPVGFTLTADLAPEKRLIVLLTATRRPGDAMTCNILYPVRTTYTYRIAKETIVREGAAGVPPRPIPKRPPSEPAAPDPAQAERLRALPVNQWVPLANPGRAVPTRTWGSATFDTDRGRILYWGGGHCGYEGNDVEAYDVAAHAWRAQGPDPEYPERLWDRGVRLAGVTFQGGPWTEHGRKVYAYDPASRKLVMALPIRLTTGYDPDPLKDFPASRRVAPGALVDPPSSYLRFATWTWDPETGRWELLGPAPEGVDTLVTTPRGVIGVNVHWRTRLNDAGYQLPWDPSIPPVDTAAWLLDAAGKRWKRLSREGPSPQNLYEMTALAWDSKRERLLLHGGGKDRSELWALDPARGTWEDLKPSGLAPACSREAVYLPSPDILLTWTRAGARAYVPSENAWRAVQVAPPAGVDPARLAAQNRAMVHDPARDLVLLVLGLGGDQGRASVYALRYDHAAAAGR